MPDLICENCQREFFGYANMDYWPCPKCRTVAWNRARLGYGQTSIAVQRSIAEVLDLFRRFAPVTTQAGVAQDHETGRQGVQFVVRVGAEAGFRARLLIEATGSEREQRQAWRLIVNWLKNTLIAIAFGAVRSEEAFGGFATTQELRGKSVGDMLLRAAEEGLPQLPGLEVEIQPVHLPALTDGGEGASK